MRRVASLALLALIAASLLLLLLRAADDEIAEAPASSATAAERIVGPAAADAKPERTEESRGARSATAFENAFFEGDAAANRPRTVVSGIVRRLRDGSLVTDGTVQLVHVDLPSSTAEREELLALDAEQRRFQHEYVESEIGEDGAFAIEVPLPSLLVQAVLKPRRFARANAPQFLETEIDLGARLVEGPTTLDLRADEGASISGKVVDAESGFPIRDASVSAPWWDESVSDWNAITDVEGRFKISGIRREVAGSGASSDLVASAAGHVETRIAVPPPERGLDVEGVVIALQRGVTVRGRVLFEDLKDAGQPGLRLYLYSREPGAGGAVRALSFLASVAVSGEGAFEFEPVAPTDEAWLELVGIVPAPKLRLELRGEPQPAQLFIAPLEEIDVAITALQGPKLWTRRRESLLVAGIDEFDYRAIDASRFLRVRGSSTRALACVFGIDEVRHTWSGRGERTIPPREDDEPAATIPIPVTLQRGEQREANPNPYAWSATELEPELSFELELELRGGEDSKPLRGVRVAVADYAKGRLTRYGTDDEGKVRLRVEPGRRFLGIMVAGHDERSLELSSTEPGHASYTLALTPTKS